MIDISTIFLIEVILISVIVVTVSVMWPLVIGAAWTPTSRMVVRRMLEMAEVDCRDIVYDLGSGDGRIVIEATKRHHAKAGE